MHPVFVRKRKNTLFSGIIWKKGERMKHTYNYGDLVLCDGKLMFVEDPADKEGRIGLLEENASRIEHPLFDDRSAGTYYVDPSRIRSLQERITEPDVLRTFFRLEMSPWQLVRLGRYPFADDGGTFELAEQDVERFLEKLPGSDHSEWIIWKKEFLHNKHVYCPDPSPGTFSLAFLWQCLQKALSEMDPAKDDLAAIKELWQGYYASRHYPPESMRLHRSFRKDMILHLLDVSGRMHLSDSSVRAAERLLDELIDEGDLWAMECKAHACFDGHGILEEDHEEALYLYERLYEAGVKDACLYLGQLYVEKDGEKAERYLREAIENGHAYGRIALADLLHDSRKEEAVGLLQECVHDPLVQADACVRFGEYREEDGDAEGARNAYEEAARAYVLHVHENNEALRRRIQEGCTRTNAVIDEQVQEALQPRRTLRVSAAVIIQKGCVLATQRGYGEGKDGWEFPGGKIEEGETGEEALVREIREELQMTVEPQKLLTVIEYEYPAFHLRMECWLCHITNGTPVLVEHEAARWLLEEQIDSVDWLPADRTILDLVRRELSKESVY